MKAFVSAGCTALKKGQTLLYPTDTIWGIGCDATNPDAVNSIYEIKQRADSKALICLVSDLTMLEKLTGPLETKIKKIEQFFFTSIAVTSKIILKYRISSDWTMNLDILNILIF